MKLAFAVFELSKGGGVERDCARLAKRMQERGHEVTLFTTDSCSLADTIPVRILKKRGRTNHTLMTNFAADLKASTGDQFDVLVGFQKLYGLDVLVCGDWCLADETVPFWKRFLPRYRAYMRLERACCSQQSNTYLLMLSRPQTDAFVRAWEIDPNRIEVLPTTLDKSGLLQPVSSSERQASRRTLRIRNDQTAWLWIGVQPKTKGLDRAISALALSPNSILFVVGPDIEKRSTKRFGRLAEALGCDERIRWIGYLEHAALAPFMLSCDLLLHPARLDVTGTVIVEALGAGLPVVVTENCGYSVHVRASGAGEVIDPDVRALDIARAADTSQKTRQEWSQRARDYMHEEAMTEGIEAAAKAIEARFQLR